jgi:hypothetical protein
MGNAVVQRCIHREARTPIRALASRTARRARDQRTLPRRPEMRPRRQASTGSRWVLNRARRPSVARSRRGSPSVATRSRHGRLGRGSRHGGGRLGPSARAFPAGLAGSVSSSGIHVSDIRSSTGRRIGSHLTRRRATLSTVLARSPAREKGRGRARHLGWDTNHHHRGPGRRGAAAPLDAPTAMTR